MDNFFNNPLSFSGPLFQEILDKMEKKMSNEISQKVWMYSGHDTTIANILQALDMFSPPQCPPYLSMILFELRKKEDDFFVSVRTLFFFFVFF